MVNFNDIFRTNVTYEILKVIKTISEKTEWGQIDLPSFLGLRFVMVLIN